MILYEDLVREARSPEVHLIKDRLGMQAYRLVCELRKQVRMPGYLLLEDDGRMKEEQAIDFERQINRMLAERREGFSVEVDRTWRLWSPRSIALKVVPPMHRTENPE